MGGLALIGTYVVIAAAGEFVAVGLGLITDRINDMASLLVFFVSSTIILAIAWPIAVRVSGRFAE
ncbi:MAG: hypothetical protein RO009_04615 [Pseudorhodoplanes sp.]|jgi:hypothetical protein|nr:hypothetical protein [Pseudorhodoplanes sp.]